MKILITGGAGFIGAALARYFRDNDDRNEVVAFDNLRRRGSECHLQVLSAHGVEFVHGDVRNAADLDALTGNFDVLIEASAEPTVHAGVGNSPRYALDTNILGAMNCLEFARSRCGGVVFLSSSRVYSIAPLSKLPLETLPTRFEVADAEHGIAGLSFRGISEDFSCSTHRSYYGATKLAAELLCQEYTADAGLPIVTNRCGVIAGPGQFGRTDQGVFTLWVARHVFDRPLTYTGFGGTGLQVRDLLHVEDLCELVDHQLRSLEEVSGETFNVGGGRAGSVSLREYTTLCREVTGHEVTVLRSEGTSPVDIPWYVSDHSRVTERLGWIPRRRPEKIVRDIVSWIGANEDVVFRVIQ